MPVIFRPLILFLPAALVLQSCSTFTQGSRADFAIPGCEKAWVSVADTKGLTDLKTLVVHNCPELYEQGWRLNDKRFKRDIVKPQACSQSFKSLAKTKQLDNVKFMVTHNCPVFYRHGWIIPPN
ncbi:MAG: hypothetical protein P8Y24_05725 [Gammaproteobacteria bacterium]